MGTEADRRNGLCRIGGDGGVDIAKIVQPGVGEARCQQFLDEEAAQVLLFFGGRLGR